MQITIDGDAGSYAELSEEQTEYLQQVQAESPEGATLAEVARLAIEMARLEWQGEGQGDGP